MGGLLPYVDAFIALLATLYGFALIVTLLIELVHRLLGLDAKRLGRFIAQFVRDEGQRGTEAAGALAAIGAALDKILDPAVTTVSASAGVAVPAAADLEDPKLSWWSRLRGGLLERLDWAGFLQEARKFQQWRAFELKLAAKSEDVLKAELTRLQVAYDELCGRLKTLWGRYARGLAFGGGLLLALALNLNALTIFGFYLHHPEATQESIDRLETVATKVQALQARKCIGGGQADASGQAAAEDCTEEARSVLDDAVAALELVGQERQYYAGKGVPLGWESGHLPWNDSGSWLSLLGILATGLLLGLGAPQLHDLLQGLIALRGRKTEVPPPSQ